MVGGEWIDGARKRVWSSGWWLQTTGILKMKEFGGVNRRFRVYSNELRSLKWVRLLRSVVLPAQYRAM